MDKWKTIMLAEILSKEDLGELWKLIGADDTKGLDAFLQARKKELSEKEIDAKYLFYYLCHKFNLM